MTTTAATPENGRTPMQQLHDAMQRGDADAARTLLSQHAEFRAFINAPVFPFNAPAIVAHANNLAMLDVLLEFGADPNVRSAWWAGPFHALHVATGAVSTLAGSGGAATSALRLTTTLPVFTAGNVYRGLASNGPNGKATAPIAAPTVSTCGCGRAGALRACWLGGGMMAAMSPITRVIPARMSVRGEVPATVFSLPCAVLGGGMSIGPKGSS